MSTYQGCVTDECRNTAARLNSITSVRTALPFSNRMPPTAGSKANIRGIDDMLFWFFRCKLATASGFRISPRKCFASLKLKPENAELRRLGELNSVLEGPKLLIGRRRNCVFSSTAIEPRIGWKPIGAGEDEGESED